MGPRLTDHNRLSKRCPNIAKQWHPTKNKPLTPADISYGSAKEFWWCCRKCGHEWKQSAYSRRKHGDRLRCPAGNGCYPRTYSPRTKPRTKQRLTDRYRLSKQRPNITKLWHPTKNKPLTPADISYASKREFWWLCPKCGHEWKQAPLTQSRRGDRPRCPARNGCNTTDRNRLSIRCPDLIKEWHPTKNKPLTPADISYGSEREFWWLCPKCGHEWEACVWNRVRGRGCHHCRTLNSRIPSPVYWKPWQNLCEVIARLIFLDFRLVYQRYLDDIQPDIAVMGNDDNVVLIIDAKINLNINDTYHVDQIKRYSLYCPRLEFWCLYPHSGDKNDLENKFKDISIDFISSDQLLTKISDLQARKIIAGRVQTIKSETQDYLTWWRQKQSVPILREGQAILQ